MSTVKANTWNMRLPDSAIDGLSVIELTTQHVSLLQRFFDCNPEYFMATSGEPAGPNEAADEISSQLPDGMPHTKKWVFGYIDERGELAAMANVITDLMASTVHHIGTFIVATERHGTGDAQKIYRALEQWACGIGGAWMRLGVVTGNVRAERFWRAQGYLDAKQKHGYQMGNRTVVVQVMYKPIQHGSTIEYFDVVPTDRPV